MLPRFSLCALAIACVFFFAACQRSGEVKSAEGSSLKQSESEESASETQCWRKSYGRGVGTIPNACPDGDKNGALCYPSCKSGYKGVGPVCWEQCGEGYVDDGAFCRRPSPLDINAKQSYGRTAGTLMQCADGKEKDAGLCYNECKPGYKGVGPVCWQQCPADRPVSCAAGCTTSKAECAGNILTSFKETLGLVTALVERDPQSSVTATASVVDSFRFPMCSEGE